MTIDEAIKHCLEVAEQQEADSFIDRWSDDDEWSESLKENCRQCAADHRQLAEWLTELKELRNSLGAVKLKDMKEAVGLLQKLNAENDQLTSQLVDAKRLLKLAVDDFKEINSDILTCKYCKWHSVEIDECTYYPDDVPCEQICGWKYEGEALKLIGGSENE